MPGGDGTGPMGAGPMTGRGAGFCAGYPAPGYANFGGARGFWGRGGGRGWRHWFRATGLPERMGVPTYRATDLQVEKEVLQSQLNALQAELDLVKRRLSELDAAPTTGKEIGETRP